MVIGIVGKYSFEKYFLFYFFRIVVLECIKGRKFFLYLVK